jgi:hypothetical protein
VYLLACHSTRDKALPKLRNEVRSCLQEHLRLGRTGPLCG